MDFVGEEEESRFAFVVLGVQFAGGLFALYIRMAAK